MAGRYKIIAIFLPYAGHINGTVNAQQGKRSFQPAEITPFIPCEKGRAHREFVPFLLKIILIYRNVCTVLKTIFTCKLDAADLQDLHLHQES